MANCIDWWSCNEEIIDIDIPLYETVNEWDIDKSVTLENWYRGIACILYI